jgi:hypothetical protein
VTIRAQFPAIRPSLDLNFARTRALDPRITFTRASTATFVGSNGIIQTAASGAARFDHNPATGESLGLLVEEARTNLVTYGSSIQNWGNTGSWNIVSANATTAPDGTITATSIIPNVGQPSQMANGIGSNNEKVLSVFAKANGYNHLIIVAQSAPSTSAGVLFNLTGSGSIVATNYGATGIIQSLPNGWYRCTMVRSASDAATMNTFILRAANSSTPTDSYWFQSGFAGDGTSGIYLWGAQLETGSFPTSYIPTSGATVTRAADVATIQGSNWLNIWNVGGAGNSIFAEGTIAYTTTATGFGGPVMYAMDGDTGGGTAKQWYSYLEANRGPIDGTGGGGGSVELFHGGVTSRGPGTFKSCMTFDVPNDRLKSSWNTVLSAAANNAAYFNNMWALGANPRLTIGGKDLGSNRRAWCGCIKRMSIYSVGLPDAQLQALTR